MLILVTTKKQSARTEMQLVFIDMDGVFFVCLFYVLKRLNTETLRCSFFMLSSNANPEDSPKTPVKCGCVK